MGRVGSGRVWRTWNFMTRTQPDPLSKKNLWPNPTHQALKTNPTWRAGSGRVGFGRLAPNMNCNNFLEFFFSYDW